IRLKRDRLARRGASLPGAGFHDIHCPLMMQTRLAVGLEPSNALDAAHRSPRSAPLLARSEFGSPVGPATRRSIKRNKELAKSSDWQTRQSSEPLAACAFRTIHWRRGDNRFPARLNENRTGRIAFGLLAEVGDINAEMLAVLFRSRASDFALSFFRSSHS